MPPVVTVREPVPVNPLEFAGSTGGARLAVAALNNSSTLLKGFGASAAQPNPVISKKEVKALIQTAKTPEDHMKLARYYHYEANQLQAVARDHEEMGAEYFKNPSRLPPDMKNKLSIPFRQRFPTH